MNNNQSILNENQLNSGMCEDKWDTLLQMIREKNCTPFLGAGACWPTLPLGVEVARELAQKYKYPLPDRDNLSRVTQYIAIKRDATALKYEVARNFKSKGIPNFGEKNNPHSILAELPFPIYITTNYDNFMYKALGLAGRIPVFEYCRWNSYISSLVPHIDDQFEPSIANPLIYHLHGQWDIPHSMVLTEDDYIDFLITVTKDINERLHHRILRSLSGTSLIFIGYDLQDMSFRSIFKSIINTLAFGLERTNVSVQITPQNKHRNIIKRDIEILQDIITNIDFENDCKQKMINIISHIFSISDKKVIDKKLLYKKTNFLEKQIANSSIENFQKQSLLSRINTLQNEINQISIEDEEKSQEALRFIEKYFEKFDICIYWGEVKEFAKELSERWKNYPKV